MSAWIIRAGRLGEREERALSEGRSAVGWHELGDLASADTKDKMRAIVKAGYPTASPGRVANYTGQLWAIRDSIKTDDLIVMPLKSGSKKLAIGICTGPYTYKADDRDPDSRHTIPVDWKTQDVSRAVIKDDLLNTINGAMTVFQASKHDAERRLRAVLETGVDPGRGAPASVAPGSSTSSTPSSSDADTDHGDDSVVDPDPAPTLEATRDRVRTHLVENFKGHRLTELVAAILRVEGYVCDVSPPGPDQGVDIIGGRGPLGLDSPTVIVEVKSEDGPIGSTVVRGLQGAMNQHRADQCLLVAWGGLNRQARAEIRTDRLRLRVWEADDIIDRLFATYDRLPDDLRLAVPLKRTWVLDEEMG